MKGYVVKLIIYVVPNLCHNNCYRLLELICIEGWHIHTFSQVRFIQYQYKRGWIQAIIHHVKIRSFLQRKICIIKLCYSNDISFAYQSTSKIIQLHNKGIQLHSQIRKYHSFTCIKIANTKSQPTPFSYDTGVCL